MGFGYVVLAGFMGEIVEENGDVCVWEVRLEIKRYTIADSSRSSLQAHDQPPLLEIAYYFEEFWTSGELIPAGMGMRVGRREEVLKVTLEGDRLQVTVRVIP